MWIKFCTRVDPIKSISNFFHLQVVDILVHTKRESLSYNKVTFMPYGQCIGFLFRNMLLYIIQCPSSSHRGILTSNNVRGMNTRGTP